MSGPMQDSGWVHVVYERLLGTAFTADHSIGETVLDVADVSDFNEAGCTVAHAGSTYQLTELDDDASTVTITPGLVAAASANEGLVMWDDDLNTAAVEVLAQVEFANDDGDNELATCTVKQGMVDRLPLGDRGGRGESVTVTSPNDSGGLWYVDDVIGKRLTVDLSYATAGTVPNYTPSTAPAQSPDLVVYGLVSGVVLSADPSQVESGTDVAFHVSLTSGFTPDGSTLLANTPTRALVQTVTTLPDGSPFPLDTEVYFRTVASNVVGTAAAGVEVQGATNPDAVAVVAAETIVAQTGIIEKVFTDRVQFGTGYLDSGEGMVLPQPGGRVTRMTNDGFTPSQIAGYVIIDGGTVLDNLNAYGLTQVFGRMTFTNGISDPAVAATLSRDWNNLDTGLTASSLPTIWHGLCPDISDANYLVTVGVLFGGTLRKIHKTTGAVNAFVFPSFSDFQPTGGIVSIGSNYYMLAQRLSDAKWRIYKYDSALAYVSDFAVSDTFANQPALGTDGSALLVSWVTSTDSMRLRVYTVGGSLSSDDTVLPSGTVTANRALGGVYRGAADFGSSGGSTTRTVIAAQNGTVYVFNNALTRVTADEFERAGGSAVRGLHWDGTRFRHIDGNARFWDYATGHVQSSTIWGGYVWYDGDTSSGSLTHETKVSPAESFTWPARSRLTVTGKPAPEAGVTDPTRLDLANLVRIYAGASSTTMRLQDGGGTNSALPIGETELSLESLDTGSAVAPTSSDFDTVVANGGWNVAEVNATDGDPVGYIDGDGTGRLLKQMQAGQVSSGTLTAGVDKTIAVTLLQPFPSAAFSAVPSVRNSSGNPGNFHTVTTNYTASGFEIIVRRDTGTAAVDIDWIAVYQTQ